MDNAYNEAHVEIFNKYHRNDEPGRLFAQDIAKVQDLVKKAGDGGINLRRGQIVEQVNQALAIATNRHHEARRQQADVLREQYSKHVKDRSKPNSTDRLADFHETQARIKAMTTSALETRYVHPTTARKEHTFKATVFKSPVELDLVITELESRGSNVAEVLRESMAATPRGAIGDAQAALLLDQADSYTNKIDFGTVILRDERDSPIGILAESLVDMSPLERVPA